MSKARELIESFNEGSADKLSSFTVTHSTDVPFSDVFKWRSSLSTSKQIQGSVVMDVNKFSSYGNTVSWSVGITPKVDVSDSDIVKLMTDLAKTHKLVGFKVG